MLRKRLVDDGKGINRIFCKPSADVVVLAQIFALSDYPRPRMVPQNSHGQPPRSFSPEVEEQLVRALSALSAKKQTEPDAALEQALESAGREARERALHPEDLILTFKRLEHRLDPHGPGDDPARLNFRTKLIRLLLEAYYSSR